MTIRSSVRKWGRIIYATIYNFWRDDCYTKAATLTFYTLQSLVPFLAAALGIAKGFGFQEYLEHLLTKSFPEQQQMLNYAIPIAYSTLKDIQGAIVTGIGVLFLFYTNISLLGYIEISLNDIWKIKTSRSFPRKISDYIATLVICPVVLVASSSLTVYLKTQLEHFGDYPYIAAVSVYILWLFNLVPILLSWLLFFLLYFLMPNEKLSIYPRVIAAIFAGSLFQLWQIVYINLQIQIFHYNFTYGAFAILPLFLIWVQVSWLIALAGAELAANMESISYSEVGDFDNPAARINKKQFGLLVLYQSLSAFYSAQPPPSDAEIAHHLKVPLNDVQEVLNTFVDAQILTPIALKDGSKGYHLLSDPSQMDIKKISGVLDKNKGVEYYVEPSHALDQINIALHDLDEIIQHSPQNITLNTMFPTA